MNSIPEKTIGRLSLYRRLLNRLRAEDKTHLYSYELATLAGGTPARVRRDLMAIGYNGNPAHGYEVEGLIESLGHFLDTPQGQPVVLVGIGNLGRAILSFFTGRRPRLYIVAAFDSDPAKVNRVIHGCRCYPMQDLPETVRGKGITVGIICVPAGEAQPVAEQLAAAGVRGILNFAPVRLHLPGNIYVEDMDMTMALEKVSYFAARKPNNDPGK